MAYKKGLHGLGFKAWSMCWSNARGKLPRGNCPGGNCPGEIAQGKLPTGNCPGEIAQGKLPTGNCPGGMLRLRMNGLVTLFAEMTYQGLQFMN